MTHNYSELRMRMCKIVGLERSALRAAILHECQNYLGPVCGGAVWEEARKIFFSPPPSPPPPPTSPRAIIPDARPLGTFENQDSRGGKTRYI